MIVIKKTIFGIKNHKRYGFPDYFLVVWDYIKFARDNSIPVGPGRGSAAGSLVAYALQITNIDPVEHGLFEKIFKSCKKVYARYWYRLLYCIGEMKLLIMLLIDMERIKLRK